MEVWEPGQGQLLLPAMRSWFNAASCADYVPQRPGFVVESERFT